MGDAATSSPNANAARVDVTFWIETVQNADGYTTKQIQYTQRVDLIFSGLTWPHVSVATLRPPQQPGVCAFQRVASAQTGVGTQYVAIGGGQLWHTIDNTGRPWQTEFGLVETLEGNNPGEFTLVAVAGIGNDLHVTSIADGQLWHTIRHQQGDWQTYFGLIDTAAPNYPGTFAAISALALGTGYLQVTGVSNDNLWFTVRHNSGSREPFTRTNG